MSEELLERVFAWINEYLESEPEEPVSLVWHGGEPLLLGAAYFRKALSIQDRMCATTAARISHAVQSNLTLLDEEMIDALQALGIRSLSTSFEPLPGLRGIGAHGDSRAYNERFFQGLRVLRAHGFGWGLIYVVTRRALALPRELFTFLTNLTLTNGFSFNPVLLYGEDAHGLSVTAGEFADFLGSIFPLWWAHRDRWPNVEPFSRLERAIVQKQRALGCADSGACHRNHVYVGPRGELSQCGRAADWNIIDYGTIMERSLRDILSDTSEDQPLARRNEVLRAGECSGCRFWDICHGGCPLDSFPARGDLLHKSEWCDARRLFLSKYFEPVTGARFEGLADAVTKGRHAARA
jgi:uncharacterized protein